ncbi:hypothetical protein HN51_044392, partial [Arachis hypogaea]
MLAVVAAAPLVGSSASRARVWSLSSVTLLLGVEFAVDEEALPPFLQCFAYDLLHILSSTLRHPNLIEHTSEKAKEAKDIQ